MKLTTQTFPSAKGEITWFTITNENGAQVVLSSLGAGVVAVKLPEADGTLTDVVLGYDDPEAYFGDGPCAGKTPGRYANRIANGQFTIDGTTYQLPINNGPNSLHGGPDGFQNHIWACEAVADNKVVFRHHSPDGDSGYPGNLEVTVVYTWDNSNALTIDYTATTDAPTVVNLTNHTYFNLNGHNTGSCLGHYMKLNAPHYLPTDPTQVPLGPLAEVAGTPMDFLAEHTIGERIRADFEPLHIGKGYDHCWMVADYDGTLREVVTLRGDRLAHTLTVYSDQPAVQVYTGNWLDGSPEGKSAYTYHDNDAVAIECQGAPDAPNHPNLPSQRLNPGETYTRTIRFAFT